MFLMLGVSNISLNVKYRPQIVIAKKEKMIILKLENLISDNQGRY